MHTQNLCVAKLVIWLIYTLMYFAYKLWFLCILNDRYWWKFLIEKCQLLCIGFTDVFVLFFLRPDCINDVYIGTNACTAVILLPFAVLVLGCCCTFWPTGDWCWISVVRLEKVGASCNAIYWYKLNSYYVSETVHYYILQHRKKLRNIVHLKMCDSNR